jgi:endonuclease/exonuclease/phosphatase family metal-dependent hydrolase
MKILSWNILANEFIAKRFYPMIPSELLFKRAARTQRIINTLTRVDADVMLLQEVMLSEYNTLHRHFAGNYTIIRSKHIVWQNEPSYSFNVILLRNTMFSLNGLGGNDMGGNYMDFGVMVKCLYKNKNKNKNNTKNNTNKLKIPITIINVHLDDIAHAKRKQQLQQLETVLKTDQNVILGGDFNENYSNTSPLYKIIKSTGLSIMNYDPTYFIKRKVCIDNIMLKGAAPRPHVRVLNEAGPNVMQQFIEYGSDHLPVIVDTNY